MSLRFLATTATLFIASTPAFGALVAGWSITTAFPTGTGNVPTGQTYSVGAADQGSLTAGSELMSWHAAAAATYTSPSGNGSQYSFSSNNWAIGDYYQAKFSTSGFADPITISWDQARSSTGPSAFEVVYSIDGGANWNTALASYTVLQSGGGGAPGTWSSLTYNALYTNSVMIAGLENQSEVLVRFRATGAAAGATGSNRIDNVLVYSGEVPAPGAIALLAVAGLAARRRR